MLGAHAAPPDAGLDRLAEPLQPPTPAWRSNHTLPNNTPEIDSQMFDSLPVASDAIDASIDVPSPMQLPDRASLPAVQRHEGTAIGWEEYTRRLSLDLAGTTPTLLPDLLRAVSRQAGNLAGDPFNALDNN